MRYWNRFTDYVLEALFHKRSGAVNQEDARDYKLEDHLRLSAPSKSSINLFNIYNQWQGRTNHCTSYSAAHVAGIMMTRIKKKILTFDAEDIWKLQLEQGTAREDQGDFINSAPKAIINAGMGDIMGNVFPYQKYVMVREDQFKEALSEGRPIMTGTRISYPMVDSEYNLKRGGEGGHAFCVVGYDDEKQHYICLNSWAYWGWKNTGLFYVKYEDASLLFRGYAFL